MTGLSMLTFNGQHKVNTSPDKKNPLLVPVVSNGCFLTLVMCYCYLLWLQYVTYSQNGHTFTKRCIHKDI